MTLKVINLSFLSVSERSEVLSQQSCRLLVVFLCQSLNFSFASILNISDSYVPVNLQTFGDSHALMHLIQ